MTTPKKHPGGRPKSTGPIKQRRNVTLLDAEWLALGELGKDDEGKPNVSHGITLALARARDKSAS